MVDVICPGCKGRFHETTDLFRYNAKSHDGSMFKLKEKYGPNGFNWSSFPNNVGIKYGDLDCPSCGAPYCSGGFKVILAFNKHPDHIVSTHQDRVVAIAKSFVFEEERHTLIPPEQKPNDAHVCDKCGKVCKSYAGLVTHMMRKHNERPDKSTTRD